MEMILQISGIILMVIAVIFISFFYVKSKNIAHLLVTETENKPTLIGILRSASDICYDIISSGLSEARKIVSSSVMNQEAVSIRLL